MRMVDLLIKKREGKQLTSQEIREMISSYVKGDIPDYQMSAMLMAICWKGMSDEELATLTMAMAHSGEIIDLSAIEGTKVDKHSTGGVGDKTTFIVGPIVAACGGKVAKMSGRGLGHTGGTIDKMEAIPGIRSSLSKAEFVKIVNDVGLAVIGQSENLAPADKMLYALRDVTGTVENIPLIASSVMSKKIAAGCDAILLDVKVGKGAFMKTLDEAIILAEKMVAIGVHNSRETMAIITDMNTPLGYAVGNALEMREVVEVLQNRGPSDLRRECIEIAGSMLYLLKRGSLEECRSLAEETLVDGRAFSVFCRMVRAQGGDETYIHEPQRLALSSFKEVISAPQEGYLSEIDALICGKVSVNLGAGRAVKDDVIDYGAGILLCKKVGDYVKANEVLAELYSSRKEWLEAGRDMLKKAFGISEAKPVKAPMVYARVTKDGVERLHGEI